jgi:hypothetical protein
MKKTRDDFIASASDPLLYRSQFVLGPHFIDEFESWKRIRIDDSMCLTVHPSLLTSQTFYQDKSITLLGFVLDPDHPEANDSDIINSLVQSFSSFRDLFERTTKLGGRWILIVDDGHEIVLFHDVVGLRQVFYTDVHQIRDIWCASQPGMIAGMLDLQMDGEAVEFIKGIWSSYKEYWVPGDGSLYKEIRHLMPNHYLNLKTGQSYRYWPDKNLDPLSLDEAIEKISGTLTGLMQSASNRFDLALALSAGWDSRLVLASCKGIRHRISYYSIIRPGMPRSHSDIKVPSRLLSRLGLKHDIIECPPELSSEFVEIFNKNVPFAHDVVPPRMQALLDYYKHRKVAVTGGVSEVARCHYRLPESQQLTVSTLPQLSSMARIGDHPFAMRLFEKWLVGLGEVYNLDVLDLFMWEQDFGNWLAMLLLEFDIAWQDIFTPFNARSLLLDLLSVDEQYRRPPKYELYRRLMVNLWPEVLCEPINPHKKKKKGLRSIRRQSKLFIKHRLEDLRQGLNSRIPYD